MCLEVIVTREVQAYRRANAQAKAFNKARERLRIRYRDRYNVRHNYATRMLAAGMKPAYCAKVLGHSLEMFFRNYATWTDQDENARQEAIWFEI